MSFFVYWIIGIVYATYFTVIRSGTVLNNQVHNARVQRFEEAGVKNIQRWVALSIVFDVMLLGLVWPLCLHNWLRDKKESN